MKHQAKIFQAAFLITLMSIPETAEAGALKKLKQTFAGLRHRVSDVKEMKNEASRKIAEVRHLPDAISEVADSARAAIAHGGRFFQAPVAVDGTAALRVAGTAVARPSDAVGQFRWDARQTYRSFWSSRLAEKEAAEGQVREVRAQQDQLVRLGYGEQARQMQAAVDELEVRFRADLAVDPAVWIKPTSDLSVFGYDVTCAGCDAAVVRQSFALIGSRLDDSYQATASELERKAIAELAREIDEIDALLEAGEFVAAQQRLDAEWARILATN